MISYNNFKIREKSRRKTAAPRNNISESYGPEYTAWPSILKNDGKIAYNDIVNNFSFTFYRDIGWQYTLVFS